MHRFPEELAAHGICRPCVAKRQLVARVVVPVRLGRRLTVQELLDRMADRDRRLAADNAARMRAVAASLPRQRTNTSDGANKQKTAGAPTPTAFTTPTARDGSGGCTSDGKR